MSDDNAQRFKAAAAKLWRTNKVFKVATAGSVALLIVSGLLQSTVGAITGGSPPVPGTTGNTVMSWAGKALKDKLAGLANSQPQSSSTPAQGQSAHPILGGLSKALDNHYNGPQQAQSDGNMPAPQATPDQLQPSAHPMRDALKDTAKIEAERHPLLGNLAKAVAAAKGANGEPLSQSIHEKQAPMPGMVTAAPASSVPVLSSPGATQVVQPQMVTMPQAAMGPTVSGGTDMSSIFAKKPGASQSTPTTSTGQ